MLLHLRRAFLRSSHISLFRPFSSSAAAAFKLGRTSTEGPGSNAESSDDFERRLFGNNKDDGLNKNSFFQKIDRIEKARGKFQFDFGSSLRDDGFDSLRDGLDSKLMNAAEYNDPYDVVGDDYQYRPDMLFTQGTYDIQDLDLTKKADRKFPPQKMIDTSTKEVLKKADFRNVKFLAQFITEAGIIVSRRKSGISAKAQRKVAREIKTARAFGLMPFITMGTQSFVPGRSMKDDDPEQQLETFYSREFRDPSFDAN